MLAKLLQKGPLVKGGRLRVCGDWEIAFHNPSAVKAAPPLTQGRLKIKRHLVGIVQQLRGYARETFHKKAPCTGEA